MCDFTDFYDNDNSNDNDNYNENRTIFSAT